MRTPPAGIPGDPPTAVEAARAQSVVARIRGDLLAGDPRGAPPDVVAAHTSARRSLGGVPVVERLERTEMRTLAARRRGSGVDSPRPGDEAEPRAAPREASPTPGFVLGLLVGFTLGRRRGRRSRR